MASLSLSLSLYTHTQHNCHTCTHTISRSRSNLAVVIVILFFIFEWQQACVRGSDEDEKDSAMDTMQQLLGWRQLLLVAGQRSGHTAINVALGLYALLHNQPSQPPPASPPTQLRQQQQK